MDVCTQMKPPQNQQFSQTCCSQLSHEGRVLSGKQTYTHYSRESTPATKDCQACDENQQQTHRYVHIKIEQPGLKETYKSGHRREF